MTNQQAVLHLENMKWLKGYDNTSVGGMPLADIIDDIIAILREQKPVVLCRDCKYWNAGTCLNDNVSRQIEDCGCYPDFVTDSSWFCAEGERG